jgi:peptide chain release factor subunit 1
MKAKLGQYRVAPTNGLVLFVGYYENKEGKTKMINYGFEPFAPLQQSLYYCGSHFKTQFLREQISITNQSYGFIIIDGVMASFHTLSGGSKKTLYKFDKAELPKKHGRGGQSQNRFARIREIKRDWYTSKIAEFAVMHFIDSKTNIPIVNGMILAGCADLKHDLGEKLDQRLKSRIIAYIDVQYGGESGFNEAIEKSEGYIETMEYQKERKVISRLFDHIAKNTDLYCYGLKETMYSFTSGCVETLIIWDHLPFIRVEAVSRSDPEKKEIFYLKNENESIEKNDGENREQQWEIIEEMPLLDWILEHYKDYGSNIELVSNQSSEGNQFALGFGGLASLLRYSCKMPEEDMIEQEDDVKSEEESSYELDW